MNIYSMSLLFFSFCCLLVGILILLKRNDETSQTFLLFSLLASGWGIANSWMFGNESNFTVVLTGTRIAHFCSLFIPPTWLHCVYAYVGISRERKKIIKFLYALSAFLSLFAFSNFFIPTIKPILNFRYYTQPGLMYHGFTVEFFVAISCAFYELFRFLNNQTGESKKQAAAFTIATFIAFLGGSLTFLPAYDIPFPQYALLMMPFYPFIMAYAIIRHRLMDPEEVLAIHRDKLALIGLMSASINHEIKNPLFLIQELAKKLEKSEPEQDRVATRSVAQSILQQTERMRSLAVRLSEFSKSNPNNSGQADLKQAIDNALFFASQEMKYGNITTQLSLPPDLPKIKGDQSQFEQIFLNLILNAYHAMPNGGTLKIKASHDEKCLEIQISDTGAGILKDHLKDIFKPFYTTKSYGTGLGLYIVKTLVEKYGGRISVESTEEQGAVFTLKLRP